MEKEQNHQVNSNNKRIAKNTLLLYIRMLFVMGVNLFTSRVILKTLGVEDFGIYSVVGGIITMFTFINAGMISATQRFITFEIGRGDIDKLKKVFSTSLQIHAIISVVIFVLGETIGLWFLYEKMVIPEERMVAAIWVYQCSIIACMVNIMSIPYNADIVAHEKMSAFAYISIIEVSLKLAIVYSLLIFPWDKLVVYSVLYLSMQIVVRFIYGYYCNRHFEESKYRHCFDKPLFKEMVTFAGWSFWGNLSAILYSQGLNLLLNVFFGPVINAARGIAVQVLGAMRQLVANFQMALNPQITKNYATNNFEQMHLLMYRSAKFSFYLFYIVGLPVFLETNFLLRLWLVNVPESTVIFIRLMLLISLFFTTVNPIAIANQSTGNVKKYQIIEGSILLTIVPISYFLLKCGFPAYIVFVVHLGVELIAQVARLVIIRNQIKMSIYSYVKNVYYPTILVTALSIALPVYVYTNFCEGWTRLILVTTSSIVVVSFVIMFFGLAKNERNFILQKLNNVFVLIKRNM